MTHEQAQDLLLDLAFGELDAERKAEVEGHLEGCAECRRDKAELEEARRLSAPLRESEELPPGFDDRILEAARAQARLDHEGNVGRVIEVSGNVRPLGVEAARIDAHGPVKVRPEGRRRPRWMVRAALGGSIAAAAALALVVSTTLQTRREAEKASRAQGEEYRIRVQPAAPDAVGSALRDAEANRERAPAAAPPPSPAPLEKKQMAPAEPAPQPEKLAEAGGEPARRDSVRASNKPSAAAQGAVAGSKAKAEAPAATGHGEPLTGTVAAGKDSAALAQNAVRESDAAQAAPVAESQRAPAAPGSRAKVAAVDGAAAKGAGAQPTDAGALEARAQQARHSGDYALAASLYRSAAGLRGRDDESTAAWDLAHAVECLSAAGRFDEAKAVRDELARLHPAQTAALSAARRAVREVDVPDEVPATKPR